MVEGNEIPGGEVIHHYGTHMLRKTAQNIAELEDQKLELSFCTITAEEEGFDEISGRPNYRLTLSLPNRSDVGRYHFKKQDTGAQQIVISVEGENWQAEGYDGDDNWAWRLYSAVNMALRKRG